MRINRGEIPNDKFKEEKNISEKKMNESDDEDIFDVNEKLSENEKKLKNLENQSEKRIKLNLTSNFNDELDFTNFKNVDLETLLKPYQKNKK
jgi:hypothetical protein